MPTREESRARTRESLIDAGLQLAEQTSLTKLSVNRVVATAGVSKGSFFHHFGDRATFLLALHRRFHDRVVAEIQEVTVDLAPGRERLIAGSDIYLDSCLGNKGVRALLLEARAEPVIAAEVRSRNEANARLCRPDFVAMSWKHPLDSARLWVGMVSEAALIELDFGSKRRPAARSALRQFLGQEI